MERKQILELIEKSRGARAAAEEELGFEVPESVFQHVFWYSLNKIVRYPKSCNIGFDYLPYLLRTELHDFFVREEINLRSEPNRQLREERREKDVRSLPHESVQSALS